MTSVRLTPEVDSVKPAGIWVVVNTALEGTRSTELPHSELVVGPNTYSPTDVFCVDTLMGEISPGITLRGSWVFDVAPALVAPDSSDPMTLLVWVGDGGWILGWPSGFPCRVRTCAGSTPSRWTSREERLMRARLSTLWVRNLIGAVVVAIAVGVVITTILGDQWDTYRNTVVPATVVAKGQSGSAGGQTWKIDSVKHLNRNPASYGPKLPEGTVLTVVTVDRSGPVKDEVCYG